MVLVKILAIITIRFQEEEKGLIFLLQVVQVLMPVIFFAIYLAGEEAFRIQHDIIGLNKGRMFVLILQ